MMDLLNANAYLMNTKLDYNPFADHLFNALTIIQLIPASPVAY